MASELTVPKEPPLIVVVVLSFPMGKKERRQSLRQLGLLDVHLSLAVALSTIQETERFLPRFHPNLEGEYPEGVSGTSHLSSFPPTWQEDLRLEGYLEYPLPQRHYTLINIHVFSGI
ncbi:hypothetical protein TNCV_4057871 [Trichonephila clavipes]|nr:hypothetical protein TNCV_4057871 [Trichonephila clavipes]